MSSWCLIQFRRFWGYLLPDCFLKLPSSETYSSFLIYSTNILYSKGKFTLLTFPFPLQLHLDLTFEQDREQPLLLLLSLTVTIIKMVSRHAGKSLRVFSRSLRPWSRLFGSSWNGSIQESEKVA